MLKVKLPVVLVCFLLLNSNSLLAQQASDTVSIEIDLQQKLGPLKPIWAFFGYDEPNYTYMKDGRKLLTEIAQLSPVPVYVRVHSLLVSGDGKAALKWGSTNAYTEVATGKPVYDWRVIDSIFDTFISRGMKPIAQIGFMPEALSIKPQPYRHYWKPGAKYNDIYTGWAYPPRDYKKFATLVFEWVRHSVARYGKKEVESWYWELWNEPDIGYWQGTVEEYIKLYDYTADAVKRALPGAKIGGPETTGPASGKAAAFLKTFLDHIVKGKNHVTGKVGAPLDLVTFHAKGQPKLVNGVVQMNMARQLSDIENGFCIIASYPTLRNLPVIIGESDPEGCAACSEDFSPQNAYRNGTMYSSYTAASFARKHDLAAKYGINLLGAVTWAFEFEDQPWFAGFRDLATNGVNKPVLNIFRMFGLMQGNRVAVNKDLAHNYRSILDAGVRGTKADVNAFASANDRSATAMIWNYHDDNIIDVFPAMVRLQIAGIRKGKVRLSQYRVDQEFSNAYTVWKKMGSPRAPDVHQIRELERAGQLMLFSSPEWVEVKNGKLTRDLLLPRQGVSFIQLDW